MLGCALVEDLLRLSLFLCWLVSRKQFWNAIIIAIASLSGSL